jgi:hypothetical protein
MSFEPTPTETTRPTTDIQPLVPIQPDDHPDTTEPTPTTDQPKRPRETDYASPYTRHREEILPGVPSRR